MNDFYLKVYEIVKKIPKGKVCTYGDIAAYIGTKGSARTVGYDENFIELMDRERKYRGQQNDWQQFQNWKKHRNPARAALEAQHGYDAKHAMHLVRLLKMCKEILETGHVQVRRPDREELLAIRNGAWSYEQLLEWAETQDRALDEVRKRSPLPHSPDRAVLDALCLRLTEQALSERRTK